MSEDAKTDINSRAVTRTVSMPYGLWEAFDAHAKSKDGDRSSCMQRLAEQELNAHGKMPGSDAAKDAAKDVQLFGEVKDIVGRERVMEALRQLAGGALLEVAAGGAGR